MENNEIVQQPADLLTLSENLAKAGVKFIEEASGLSKINNVFIISCMIVFDSYRQSILFILRLPSHTHAAVCWKAIS